MLWFFVRLAPGWLVWLTRLLPACPFPVAPYRADAAILRKRGLQSLDGLLAASAYHEHPDVRQAILALKYRCRPLAARWLADMIVTAVWAEGISADGAVLCPVPCTWWRRHVRGYNQAELLARSVGHALWLPTRRLVLRRWFAGSQLGRSRRERFAALTDAIKVRGRARIPLRVILIDDVATTGATLDACARALKNAGAQYVEAWVVAHDPWERRKMLWGGGV